MSDMPPQVSDHSRSTKEDGPATLFVGDLARSVSEEVLAQAFAPFGAVKEARVIMDPLRGQSRGFGFVEYESKSQAVAAQIAMHGRNLKGRPLRVEVTMTARQILPGPPVAASNDTGSNLSSMSGDDVQSSAGSSQEWRGSLEGVLSRGRLTNSTIYVGQLPPEINEANVRALYKKFGSIQFIRLHPDSNSAYVKFLTRVQAGRAIHGTHGTVLETGTPGIFVDWSSERLADGTVIGPSTNPPVNYRPRQHHPHPNYVPGATRRHTSPPAPQASLLPYSGLLSYYGAPTQPSHPGSIQNMVHSAPVTTPNQAMWEQAMSAAVQAQQATMAAANPHQMQAAAAAAAAAANSSQQHQQQQHQQQQQMQADLLSYYMMRYQQAQYGMGPIAHGSPPNNGLGWSPMSSMAAGMGPAVSGSYPRENESPPKQ